MITKPNDQDVWQYRAEVLRVVDGDTVDVRIDLGLRCSIVERLRLDVIDTPERGHRLWKAAKDRLGELVAEAESAGGLGGRRILIQTRLEKSGRDERGKYGRLLVTLLDAWGDSINLRLLQEGLAVRYGERWPNEAPTTPDDDSSPPGGS